jgi:RHS repeat-associated protein
MNSGATFNNYLTQFAGTVHYTPRITSLTDYYPFGMQMPGRTFSQEGYRYGYQGSEKENESVGDANVYSTFYRMLDVRIGRWLSVDPLTFILARESPYVFVSNIPTFGSDPRGDICLACAVINGLAEMAFQVIDKMVFDDMDFLDAVYDVNYWSVGTSFVLGLSPTGLTQTITKIVSSPLASKFLKELIEFTIEYAAEELGEDEVSLLGSLTSKFAELGFGHYLGKMDFKFLKTEKIDDLIEVEQNQLNRFKRINDGRTSRMNAISDSDQKIKDFIAERDIMSGQKIVEKGLGKPYGEAGKEVEKSKKKPVHPETYNSF